MNITFDIELGLEAPRAHEAHLTKDRPFKPRPVVLAEAPGYAGETVREYICGCEPFGG